MGRRRTTRPLCFELLSFDNFVYPSRFVPFLGAIHSLASKKKEKKKKKGRKGEMGNKEKKRKRALN